jgi:hypothetical protein
MVRWYHQRYVLINRAFYVRKKAGYLTGFFHFKRFDSAPLMHDLEEVWLNICIMGKIIYLFRRMAHAKTFPNGFTQSFARVPRPHPTNQQNWFILSAGATSCLPKSQLDYQFGKDNVRILTSVDSDGFIAFFSSFQSRAKADLVLKDAGWTPKTLFMERISGRKKVQSRVAWDDDSNVSTESRMPELDLDEVYPFDGANASECA